MLDLSELEQWQESNRLEAKSARGGLPGLWDSVSAFANTDGGVIVLGVKENTKTHALHVVGVPDAHKMLEDFMNAAGSTDKLSLNVFDDRNARIETLGGRDVIVIEVPRVDRRQRPVYIGPDPLKGTYRRRFTGDYLCKPDEVRAMFRDSSETSLDSEAVESSGVDDLDEETIRAYRSLYNDVHKSGAVRDMPDAEFLCQVGAAKKAADGTIQPTKAGLLMFGQEWRIVYEYPSYFLDYRRETGGNRRWDDRFTSQELEWTGNVFDFYDRVYMKLKQALDVPFKLDANMRRVDETPAHEALREAIVNAITNADFSSSRAVVVRWTEEGIELKNPGTFRVGVEGAYAGGTSDARNKNLLKMFSLIQIGERAGSGVPNMVDQWMSCGYGRPMLSEDYNPEVSTVLLPLSADSDNLDSDNSPQNIVRISRRSTRENEEAIVSFIADHEGARSLDIADAVGISRTRVNQLLRPLIEGGIVKAVGGSRNRTYRIAE